MPEPAPHAAPEGAATADAEREPRLDGTGTPADRYADVPPYHVRAVYADGQWHLAVESLNHHPDRGEVDSVVVSLEARGPEEGDLPAAIDRKLRECGFDRHGEWVREGEGWFTPCVQSDSRAAPAAPPVPPPEETPLPDGKARSEEPARPADEARPAE